MIVDMNPSESINLELQSWAIDIQARYEIHPVIFLFENWAVAEGIECIETLNLLTYGFTPALIPVRKICVFNVQLEYLYVYVQVLLFRGNLYKKFLIKRDSFLTNSKGS